MSGQIKINMIKSQNKTHMKLLSDVLEPEILHKRVPHLAETAQARVEHKNRMNTLQKLGKFHETNGYNADRSLQYVANVDASIWSAVLEVFAKHDEHGQLMDDGLLYKTDETGRLKINRPFFYALLSGPLREFDMRGTISLM